MQTSNINVERLIETRCLRLTVGTIYFNCSNRSTEIKNRLEQQSLKALAH